MALALRRAVSMPPFLVLMLLLVVLSANGKKTKPTHKSLGSQIEQRHACEVCRTMVYEAYDLATELHRNATERGYALREDEVITGVIEGVCNPYVKAGQWLRLIDIFVDPVTQISKLRALENYSKCKRKCTTLAGVCVAIIDGEACDGLPGMLLKKSKSVDAIDTAICTPLCADTQHLRNKKLSKKDASEIESETPEAIDAKELDIEAVMDDMERARGGVGGAPPMEVFSRDEMLGVQDAIMDGDLEKLMELDPSAADLSQEDLDYLRLMYRGDPQAQDLDDIPEDV